MRHIIVAVLTAVGITGCVTPLEPVSDRGTQPQEQQIVLERVLKSMSAGARS